MFRQVRTPRLPDLRGARSRGAAPRTSMRDGGEGVGADLPEGVRELDHTADAGIEVDAPDLETLFDRAARALRVLAVDERIDRVGGQGEGGPKGEVNDAVGPPTHTIELEAADPATLLVRWLNELLYRIDAEGLAYESATLDLDGGRLRARIRETRLPRPGAPIKAITYHGLECGPRADGGWNARVIFDI